MKRPRPLSMMKVEPRDDPCATWYAIRADTLYYTMIKYIQCAVRGDPAEVTRGLRSRSATRIAMHLYHAMQLPTAAWGLALMSRSEAQTGRGPRALKSVLSRLGPWSERRVELRATALEIARLWFTELMHHDRNYEPTGLHILRGDGRWRF